MGIVYQIPHTSRPILTTNIFTANFNDPTPGKYDFGISANQGVHVTEMFTGSIYLLERISMAATILEGEYLEAVEAIPKLTLKRKQADEIQYKLALPMVNYVDDQELVLWAYTEKGRDNLILDFNGLLDQTAALVGVTSIKVNVSYALYAIESTVFYKHFRAELSGEVGLQTMGALR